MNLPFCNKLWSKQMGAGLDSGSQRSPLLTCATSATGTPFHGMTRSSANEGLIT